eukprot:COSAG04_NODE_152_length_22459_cov_12.374597_7_plen_314_part_00
MAAAAPHIGALPANALQHMLLTATTHDNLLRFVAACARVCGEWWRAVGGSAAYGRGLLWARLPRALKRITEREAQLEERARVLKAIAQAFEDPEEGGELNLGYERIGDVGAAALGAALQAMPTIHFTVLDLEDNALTAAGVASLAPALRRPWGAAGLRSLDVRGNRDLGDAGVVALAKALLPPALVTLVISETGCGDDGLVALAAAFPTLTNFQRLRCRENPDGGARGWVALAAALPGLPAGAVEFTADGCTGMGSEGAAALVAAIPQCPRLRWLWLNSCGLDEQAKAALRAAAARVPRSTERPRGLTIRCEY